MPTILFGILRRQEASSLQVRRCRCGKNVCMVVRVELFAKRFSKCRSHAYVTVNACVTMKHKGPTVDRYSAMQIVVLMNEIQQHH